MDIHEHFKLFITWKLQYTFLLCKFTHDDNILLGIVFALASPELQYKKIKNEIYYTFKTNSDFLENLWLKFQ